MGLVDDIKNQVKKSGSNKGKFIYFKPGNKVRIRFLNDMEDGIKVLFHDSFGKGINQPCQELYGRNCQHHDEEEIRHRDNYVWSVWDHEAKEVRLFMSPVNSFTAIPALIGMYETYGTLLDRDYVLTKNGQGQNSSFSVVPMDKSKFSNTKTKPYTKNKIMEMIDKAFPGEDEESEDTGRKKKPAKNDVADNNSYGEYETKELYELCIERGLKAEKKKPKNYYVEMLEEDDAENADEEDNGEDYSSMSAKELYTQCIDKGIKVEQKKPKEYYIKKLEEEKEEEWGDDDEEESEDW